MNGVSSHDTLNRAFRLLDPKCFNECFMQWVRTIAATVEGVIAIDEKTLCNSGDTFRQTDPLHIVHAFAADHAAENFSLVKKMALNLLKADTSEKLGVANKRKFAEWSQEYLLKILGVK